MWGKLVPALLATGAVGGVAGALLLSGAPSASAVGSSSPETPVLSARRAPELLTIPLAEASLAPELEAWIGQAPGDSCLVVEGFGSTLFSHQGGQGLPGASLQKIVTSTAALTALEEGPDARLETVAASTAQVSGDGVLAGDLYLIGGGDPLLATTGYGAQLQRGGERLHDIEQLADSLAEAGVSHVQGRVIGDESRYDDARFHAQWPDRFRGQNQIGPVSALNVNDGFSDFPAEYSGRLSMVRSSDPARNAAAVLTRVLRDRGITVDGEPTTGEAPEDADPVATLPSKPMSEIVAQTLTDSDNETAELLFKEIALQEGDGGTWEAGQTAVPAVLTDAGVSMEGIGIVDGSGLSADNRITCGLIVDLLTRPETGPMIVDGLSVAGEAGTLEERFESEPVAGNLRGKTGSLRNVNALSGQLTTQGGDALTFAYIATVPEPDQLIYEQTLLSDDLPGILVDYSPGVDAEQLEPLGYPTADPEAGAEVEEATG